MKRIVTLLLCLTLFPAAAQAGYRYTNAEGEYVVELPDAPTGVTIWAQDGKVPYLDNPPKYGAVGEYALVKRVDPDTGDVFDIRITFLKADRDFLLSLTEARIKEDLEYEFADLGVQNASFGFSQGTDTLKWGTYSGHSVSKNNDTIFNVVHYLAGLESIMIVRVIYNMQNETFNAQYKTLAGSISYMGQ